MSRHWWQRKKPDSPKVMPFVPPPPEEEPKPEPKSEPMVVEESTADTAILKKLGFRRDK